MNSLGFVQHAGEKRLVQPDASRLSLDVTAHLTSTPAAIPQMPCTMQRINCGVMLSRRSISIYDERLSRRRGMPQQLNQLQLASSPPPCGLQWWVQGAS